MPVIISESLRSAVVSSNSTEGFVSILLSCADLAKLDLSEVQLFTIDSFDLSKYQPTVPPSLECAQDNESAKPAHGDCNSSDKLANAVQEVILHSIPRPLASEHGVADDEFSFQTPVILSPAAGLTLGDIPFPIFKSRAVVDAEKASGSQLSLIKEDITPAMRRKKGVSMDEAIILEQQLNRESSDGLTTPLKAQDESGNTVAGRRRSNRVRPREPLPALVVERPDLEIAEKAETLREVSEGAMIDLKASPAAKFLLQVMPWELTPSPTTSVNTPAAIPFLWEDVPGKPKPQELPPPFPSLRLPPRLTSAPPPASNSTKPSLNSTRSHARSNSTSEASNGHCHHRKNTHSRHVLQNLFTGHHRHSSHDETVLEVTSSDISPEDRDSPIPAGRQTDGEITLPTSNSGETSSFDPSPSADSVTADASSNVDGHEVKLKVDYQLSSPYVATIVRLTSPYRDLGPTGNDHKGSSRKGSRAGSSIKFFVNFLRRRRDARLATGERQCIPEKWEHVSATSVPSPSNAYRTLGPEKRRKRRKGGTARVFCRLRRKGSRLVVTIYRAIKRAVLIRRADRTKLIDDAPLQYHILQ